MTTTKKLWCCYRKLANGEKNYYYWTLSAYRKTSIKKYLAEMYGFTWVQCRKRFGMSVELVNNQITPFKSP